MPIRLLQVQFGGLCMLVQRTTGGPRGLYVLMPRMEHPGHRHCQYLHCEADFIQSGKNTLKVIRGEVVDWKDVSSSGSIQDYQEHALEISKYPDVPAVPVDNQWLRGNVGECLAARIELPLPRQPFLFLGDPAELDVPDPANPTGPGIKRNAHGRVVVNIVPDHQVDSLPVAGETLVPDKDGLLQVSFLNVPPKHLKGGKFRQRKGTIVEHANAYYQLLTPARDWCELQKKGPPIKVGKDDHIGSPDDTPDYTECEAGEFHKIPFGETFIDPYNCTIGSGCAQGNPC